MEIGTIYKAVHNGCWWQYLDGEYKERTGTRPKDIQFGVTREADAIHVTCFYTHEGARERFTVTLSGHLLATYSHKDGVHDVHLIMQVWDGYKEVIADRLKEWKKIHKEMYDEESKRIDAAREAAYARPHVVTQTERGDFDKYDKKLADMGVALMRSDPRRGKLTGIGDDVPKPGGRLADAKLSPNKGGTGLEAWLLKQKRERPIDPPPPDPGDRIVGPHTNPNNSQEIEYSCKMTLDSSQPDGKFEYDKNSGKWVLQTGWISMDQMGKRSVRGIQSGIALRNEAQHKPEDTPPTPAGRLQFLSDLHRRIESGEIELVDKNGKSGLAHLEREILGMVDEVKELQDEQSKSALSVLQVSSGTALCALMANESAQAELIREQAEKWEGKVVRDVVNEIANRAMTQPVCPRPGCGNGCMSAWPSDRICSKCGYPGLKDLPSTCRHHELYYIRNGKHAGKLGCLECPARFANPTPAARQASKIVRAPDNLSELNKEDSDLFPSGGLYLDYCAIKPNDFLVCIFLGRYCVGSNHPNRDKLNGRTAVYMYRARPDNEAAKPPPDGWGWVKDNHPSKQKE